MAIFSKHLVGAHVSFRLPCLRRHDTLFAICIKLLWAKLFLKRVPRHFWT